MNWKHTGLILKLLHTSVIVYNDFQYCIVKCSNIAWWKRESDIRKYVIYIGVPTGIRTRVTGVKVQRKSLIPQFYYVFKPI